MKYSDEQRIAKILEYAEMLTQYIEQNHIDRTVIEETYSVQWAITTPLYNIGEHAYYLTTEFKDKTAHIQWNLIAGLRHRLVHDYDSTNWEMIWDIVHTEIPELIKQLKELQKEDQSE